MTSGWDELTKRAARLRRRHPTVEEQQMTDKSMWKDWELNEKAKKDHIARLNAGWGEALQRVADSCKDCPPDCGCDVPVGPPMALPSDAAGRKAIPLASGCIDYFTSALLAVASLSRVGNEQHNPGQPLHWDRSKSGDEADALSRHFAERGTVDTDRIRHSTKVAWRALALLQKELEEQEGAPVPRGCINVPAN